MHLDDLRQNAFTASRSRAIANKPTNDTKLSKFYLISNNKMEPIIFFSLEKCAMHDALCVPENTSNFN